MPKIKIRKIKDTDFASIINLHNEHFRETRTTDNFKWEYINYSDNKFVFSVVEENDQIIATQGMIPININISGIKYLTGKTENSLVKRKHRGLLFFQVYAHAMNLCKEVGMKFVWGFTGQSVIWEKGLKFTVFRRVLYDTILIFNVKKACSEIMKKKWGYPKKLGITIICCFLRLWSVLRKKLTRMLVDFESDKNEIRTDLHSPNDILNLYKKLRKKYTNLIHIEQNINYLNWRVYHNPSIDYVTFFLYQKDNKELKAYCYLAKSKSNVYYLSDFTYQNKSVGHTLINYILDYLNEKEIGMVIYYGNKSNELIDNTFSLLKMYGFVSKKNNSPLVVKDIGFENKSILYDSKNWHINGLWSEGYDF
tara:strand:+ start:930 stop:2024 length:1095 start_codon:yes stop_codon:yes gene_type:complete